MIMSVQLIPHICRQLTEAAGQSWNQQYDFQGPGEAPLCASAGGSVDDIDIVVKWSDPYLSAYRTNQEFQVFSSTVQVGAVL